MSTRIFVVRQLGFHRSRKRERERLFAAASQGLLLWDTSGGLFMPSLLPASRRVSVRYIARGVMVTAGPRPIPLAWRSSVEAAAGERGNLKSMRNGDGEPAYKRIQNAIRQRIEAGRLKPGDPVPSERELAKIHDVSLMTARHAVLELAHEGVVERHRGAGTFVALPKVHFNKLLAYTEQMASLGLEAHSRTISLAVVNDENEVAARLGVPSGSRLVRLERVRLAGAEPVAIEICYWHADEFQPLMDESLDQSSLFAMLENKCGVRLAYADEEIDATTADSDRAEALTISRGAPLLRIRQVIYSTTGKATLYVTGFYRSGRHTLRIRRFR